MKVTQLYKHRKQRRGVALLETILIVPLLAIMTLGTVDLGIILIEYIKVNQTAYEGARVASKTLDLEIKTSNIGEVCSTNGTAVCCADASYCPGVKTNLSVAVDRTYKLLQYSDIRVASTAAPHFLKVHIDKDLDEVQVTVHTQIRLVSNFLSTGFTVKVTSTAPYLY